MKNLFKNRRTTKKGKVGEDIIKQRMIQAGFTVYTPEDQDQAHLIDFFCLSLHNGDKTLFGVESKTKPKTKYNTTGINVTQYNEYIGLLEEKNIDTLILFVDEVEGMIYGQWISKLKGKFVATITDPHTNKKIVLWTRGIMDDFITLSETEIHQIKQYNL